MMDIKKLLVSKGLVRIEKFPVYDRERVHYVLTPKTLQYFGILNKSQDRLRFWKVRLTPTTPGYYHRYMQYLFAGIHRKLGWRGSIERVLPNKRQVDVYLQRDEDEKRKALEIESSTKDLENKIKVLTDGYADELVLLYKDMSAAMWARSKLEKMKDVKERFGDRIWIGTIRDYIELLSGIVKARENTGIRGKAGSETQGDGGEGKLPGNEGEKE